MIVSKNDIKTTKKISVLKIKALVNFHEKQAIIELKSLIKKFVLSPVSKIITKLDKAIKPLNIEIGLNFLINNMIKVQ